MAPRLAGRVGDIRRLKTVVADLRLRERALKGSAAERVLTSARREHDSNCNFNSDRLHSSTSIMKLP